MAIGGYSSPFLVGGDADTSSTPSIASLAERTPCCEPAGAV
jgi:hypothetical protein